LPFWKKPFVFQDRFPRCGFTGLGMADEKILKRYTAYFRGWCQAFGDFSHSAETGDGITWLLGPQRIGLILPVRLKKGIYKKVLGAKDRPPAIVLGHGQLRIGDECLSLPPAAEYPELELLREEFRNSEVLHLYLTYHLMFPSGVRIITVSRKAPMVIFYKEIDPMRIRIEEPVPQGTGDTVK